MTKKRLAIILSRRGGMAGIYGTHLRNSSPEKYHAYVARLGQHFQGATTKENIALASAHFYAERQDDIESISSLVKGEFAWHALMKNMYIHWWQDRAAHIPELKGDPMVMLTDWMLNHTSSFERYVILSMFNVFPTKAQLDSVGYTRGHRPVRDFAPWTDEGVACSRQEWARLIQNMRHSLRHYMNARNDND